MGLDLQNPTYVCLEIPEPQRSAIRRLRDELCERLVAFPVEITIAGSSGLGAIAGSAEWATVESRLIAVCSHTPPIVTRFGGVVRFPGTDTFVLSVGDPTPFIDVHEALKHSGIAFEPNLYPFFPHCSLRMSGPLSPVDISRIFSLRVEGEFEISTMSLQARDASGTVSRVWSHALTGRSV